MKQKNAYGDVMQMNEEESGKPLFMEVSKSLISAIAGYIFQCEHCKNAYNLEDLHSSGYSGNGVCFGCYKESGEYC